ncbi:hypothetical protein ACR6C2_16990 [Streptomyces sp. INA 01156]
MKLDFESARKWLSVGPAIRKWGQPRIPGRYRVCSFISGSVTGSRTLSRRGAIRTYQHHAKKGF